MTRPEATAKDMELFCVYTQKGGVSLIVFSYLDKKGYVTKHHILQGVIKRQD